MPESPAAVSGVMSNPNNATLGTVWTTFNTPKIGGRKPGRRQAAMPSGTPNAAAPISVRATSNR